MNKFILVDLLHNLSFKKYLIDFEYRYLFENLNNKRILEYSPILIPYEEKLLNNISDYILIFSYKELDGVLLDIYERCFIFSNFEKSMCKIYEPFTAFSLFSILNAEQKNIIFSNFEFFIVLFRGEICSYFKKDNQLNSDLLTITLEHEQFELIFEKRIEFFKISFCSNYNYDFHLITRIVDYAISCNIFEISLVERFVLASLKIGFDKEKFDENFGFLKDFYEPDSMKILQLEDYKVITNVRSV